MSDLEDVIMRDVDNSSKRGIPAVPTPDWSIKNFEKAPDKTDTSNIEPTSLQNILEMKKPYSMTVMDTPQKATSSRTADIGSANSLVSRFPGDVTSTPSHSMSTPLYNSINPHNTMTAATPAPASGVNQAINSIKLQTMSLSRHQRPTYPQQEMLVQFLEANPGIAKGNLRTAKAKWATKNKWYQLAVQLNSIGGVVRDGKGWAKYWADKKYLLKRQLVQNSTLKSDGGDEQTAGLSDLEQRMIAVMSDGDPLNVTIKKMESRTIEEPHLTPTHEEIMVGMNQMSGDPLEPNPSDIHIPKRLRPAQRGQTHVNRERDRLVLIEERRVEAELMNARALQDSVNSINNLADAIRAAGRDIANAISLCVHK